MKVQVLIISLCFVVACGSRQADKVISTQRIDSIKYDSVQGKSDEEYYSEVDTFFIVIADTGGNYDVLRQQMVSIAMAKNLTIDTMGRYYDAKKDLIQLPDDDEDEVYRGDYYPRRFPSNNLSIEYLSLYKPVSGEKTMAIVTSIFEDDHSADSAKQTLIHTYPKTFVIKAEIYTGCLH